MMATDALGWATTRLYSAALFLADSPVNRWEEAQEKLKARALEFAEAALVPAYKAAVAECERLAEKLGEAQRQRAELEQELELKRACYEPIQRQRNHFADRCEALEAEKAELVEALEECLHALCLQDDEPEVPAAREKARTVLAKVGGT